MVSLYVDYYEAPYYHGAVTDHFDGKHFHNYGAVRERRGSNKFLWKFMVSNKPKWPQLLENDTYDKPPIRVEGKELRVSYVGHTTILLQTEGLNILTDPIWSNRASPFSFMGPIRAHLPGIKFSDLPKIDIVLVSHNHYDHMDKKTLIDLVKRDNPKIITPLGNDTIIKKFAPNADITTLDWDQRYEFKGLDIAAEPVQHWSSRLGKIDRNQALWAGFVMKFKGGNIFFAGDTGYGEGKYSKALGQKYGSFRLALLPIGTYNPRDVMGFVHMDPAEAIKFHKDMGAKNSLAMHHDTFRLSLEPYGEPEAKLKELIHNDPSFPGVFWVMKAGEYKTW